MALKIIIVFFTFLVVISCSKPTTKNYKIESSYNSSNRISTIYFIQNNLKIDSITVNDWYGKDSLFQINSLNWKYFYSQRCGTGCSIKNQILIGIEQNRIKKIYDSLAYYTYHSVEIDSINGKSTNKLIEYDSIHLIEKNSAWYIIHKKYLNGQFNEYEIKLNLTSLNKKDELF